MNALCAYELVAVSLTAWACKTEQEEERDTVKREGSRQVDEVGAVAEYIKQSRAHV